MDDGDPTVTDDPALLNALNKNNAYLVDYLGLPRHYTGYLTLWFRKLLTSNGVCVVLFMSQSVSAGLDPNAYDGGWTCPLGGFNGKASTPDSGSLQSGSYNCTGVTDFSLGAGDCLWVNR